MRPRRLAPAAVALSRVLAAWLAVIVLLQSLAAALALVHGEGHRHSALATHEHRHDDTRHHHHHHHADALSAVPSGDDGSDTSAAAELAGFALGPPSRAPWLEGQTPRAWHAAAAWVPSNCCPAPPEHRPRG
jgi:hypothetical protein